jgi:hypothetical protein
MSSLVYVVDGAGFVQATRWLYITRNHPHTMFCKRRSEMKLRLQFSLSVIIMSLWLAGAVVERSAKLRAASGEATLNLARSRVEQDLGLIKHCLYVKLPYLSLPTCCPSKVLVRAYRHV